MGGSMSVSTPPSTRSSYNHHHHPFNHSRSVIKNKPSNAMPRRLDGSLYGRLFSPRASPSPYGYSSSSFHNRDEDGELSIDEGIGVQSPQSDISLYSSGGRPSQASSGCSSSRRRAWEGGRPLSSRSGLSEEGNAHHNSSTASGRKLTKQLLINGWNFTKRTAASVLFPSSGSMSISASTSNSSNTTNSSSDYISKDGPFSSPDSNFNGSVNGHAFVYSRNICGGKGEVVEREYVSHPSATTTTTTTTTTDNRTRAARKVREIFESANKSRTAVPSKAAKGIDSNNNRCDGCGGVPTTTNHYLNGDRRQALRLRSQELGVQVEEVRAKTPSSPIHRQHPRSLLEGHHPRPRPRSQLLWHQQMMDREVAVSNRRSFVDYPSKDASSGGGRGGGGRPQSCWLEKQYSEMSISAGSGSRKGIQRQQSLGTRRERPPPQPVIQASTSELLLALGNFICTSCGLGLEDGEAHEEREGEGEKKGRRLDPTEVVAWMRAVDRALILQDLCFCNPANLVFLYVLIRDRLRRMLPLKGVEDVRSMVLTCLYISYSYMGNEISYPLKSFVDETTDRAQFWDSCVEIINEHSGMMLQLNASSAYFLESFAELKGHSAAAAHHHQ